MILKSFLIEKNISLLAKYNATLIYGENIGLKDDLKSEIKMFFKDTEYFNFNIECAFVGEYTPIYMYEE